MDDDFGTSRYAAQRRRTRRGWDRSEPSQQARRRRVEPARSPGTKQVLQVTSVVIIVVGALMTIGFFGSFVSGFGDPQAGPPPIGLAFLGMPLLGLGVTMAKFAFLGEVGRYVAKEVGPPARSILAPAVGSGVACGSCGRANDPGACFCDGCGQRLDRTCPSCQADNAADARFCDHCGSRLI